jgi:recombination protein RecR
MDIPDSLRRIIESLSDFPSIGPRQATRLGFYLVNKTNGEIEKLAREIADLQNIKHCSRCFFIFEGEGELCRICANPSRRQDLIMIVEKETDLISMENTGKFPGRYFITGAMPKSGSFSEEQKKRLGALKTYISKNLPDKAEEIILGFSPTRPGDFHASLIERELSSYAKRMTRLGRGLPTGGEIEFADDQTLESALHGRS